MILNRIMAEKPLAHVKNENIRKKSRKEREENEFNGGMK